LKSWCTFWLKALTEYFQNSPANARAPPVSLSQLKILKMSMDPLFQQHWPPPSTVQVSATPPFFSSFRELNRRDSPVRMIAAFKISPFFFDFKYYGLICSFETNESQRTRQL
jgi:hypothetical protein